MLEADFLTTKTRQWVPSVLPQWTTQYDCFGHNFGEEEDTVPLQYKDFLGPHVMKMECETGALVAVKRLDTSCNKVATEKIYKEVEILRELQHYHCIQVLGCYTHRDGFHIVTQPIAHCDLKHYLSELNSVRKKELEAICGPRAKILPRIMGCLAYTLHYIHQDPKIRHRDIKPENILIKGNRVLFADFGLSKTYTATQSGSSGTSAKTLMVKNLVFLLAEYAELI